MATAFPKAISYQRGDVVSTLARSQHNGWRTTWTEVTRAEMPRYREEATVKVAPPLPSDAHLSASEPFKLSLAFAESAFVVPWISTRVPGREEKEGGPSSSSPSSSAAVLRNLKLTFLYSGSDILQVKWDGTYEEAAAGRGRDARGGASGGDSEGALEEAAAAAERDGWDGVEALDVMYVWVEVVEHDVESGLVTLFGASLLACLAATALLCNRTAPPPSSSGGGFGERGGGRGRGDERARQPAAERQRRYAAQQRDRARRGTGSYGTDSQKFK